jgi:hypothetical protein
MKTEKIIYKMLTENTGEHFLDSGGAYGRHWQRNQKKSLNDFRKEKYISYDSDGYATKSLFHHLIESIDYLPYETKMLNDWIKKDKYDWVKNPNGRGHIISDVSNFMEEYFYPDKKYIVNILIITIMFYLKTFNSYFVRYTRQIR